MICSSLKAQTDKLPATEDSRASGRRARGGSRGGRTGAPGQPPALPLPKRARRTRS